MKLPRISAIALSLMMASHAHAFFFFFIPGSATRAVGQALAGGGPKAEKGNICVKENSKVGDVLTSTNGNTAKITSISGPSSRCQPANPIGAEMEFHYSFASKAGIELPDEYESTGVTDLERFNGFVLKATSKNVKVKGVIVSATIKKPNVDLQTMANNLSARSLQSTNFKQVKSQNAESLTINGMPAVRWEIVGTLKGLFGQDITYQYTFLEGDNEYLLINAYCPTDKYGVTKAEFNHLAETVTGLHDTSLAVHEHASASSPTASAPDPQAIIPSAPTVKLESVESRLEKLNQLLKEGLITRSEYAAKKKEILKGI